MRTDKTFPEAYQYNQTDDQKKNQLFKRYILIKILLNEMMDADNY